MIFSGHPHFFNQLSCGLDLVSMAGEWLTATANTNMFTYEIAPVFILMEHVVLQKMRELIGWSGGDSILAPGGSISNLYAFLAARHKMFPAYKERGLAAIGGQLVMFTSDQVHFLLLAIFSVYFFTLLYVNNLPFYFFFLLTSWDVLHLVLSSVHYHKVLIRNSQ